MSDSPPLLSGHLKRGNYGRLARDIFLLPPALIYVLVEQVFWSGANTLLRQARRLPAIANLQRGLQRLPPYAVLPLFLIPEIFSHIGGFWAAYLLARHAWAGALLAGLLLKGAAMLVAVWIYQSCEDKLLSIRGFAWVHGQATSARNWVAERMRPALNLARGSGSTIARRFTAMRRVLSKNFFF